MTTTEEKTNIGNDNDDDGNRRLHRKYVAADDSDAMLPAEGKLLGTTMYIIYIFNVIYFTCSTVVPFFCLKYAHTSSTRICFTRHCV